MIELNYESELLNQGTKYSDFLNHKQDLLLHDYFQNDKGELAPHTQDYIYNY